MKSNLVELRHHFGSMPDDWSTPAERTGVLHLRDANIIRLRKDATRRVQIVQRWAVRRKNRNQPSAKSRRDEWRSTRLVPNCATCCVVRDLCRATQLMHPNRRRLLEAMLCDLSKATNRTSLVLAIVVGAGDPAPSAFSLRSAATPTIRSRHNQSAIGRY